MKVGKIIWALVLAGSFYIAGGQDVTVRAVIDSGKALIGDQIQLKLVVDQTTGSKRVTFPDIEKAIQKPIEIISAQDMDSSSQNGRIQFLQEIQITVFDTGTFEIPELAFILNDDGRTDTFRSAPVRFQIMPVATDSTLRDIKAINRMPLTMAEAVEYSMYLFLIVLFILAVYYYSKRKKREAIEKPVIPLNEPSHTLALRELRKLSNDKPWMHNQVKFYYIRLSEILRTYIEHQFHIQSFEQTTDEILSMLKKDSQLVPSEFKRLAGILKLADLVKFAKAIPEATENAIQIDEAIQFINNTHMVNKAVPLINVPQTDNIITEEKH